MKKLNKKGFTIVEMAIVVVVIGLVAGIGLYAKDKIANRSGETLVAEAAGWGYVTIPQSGYRLILCKTTNSASNAAIRFYAHRTSGSASLQWVLLRYRYEQKRGTRADQVYSFSPRTSTSNPRIEFSLGTSRTGGYSSWTSFQGIPRC